MSIKNILNDNIKGWLDGKFNTLNSLDSFIDGVSYKNLGKNVISGGYIAGCLLTNNLDGTISLSAGTVYLREADTDSSDIIEASIPESLNMALSNNNMNFVHADYNGGTPVFSTSIIASDVNQNTTVSLYEVYRVGTTLFIQTIYQYQNNDNKRLQEFLIDSFANKRTDGLFLGETLLRNVTVSSGTIWSKLNQVVTPAFDSSGADRFIQYYLTGTTTWVSIGGVDVWSPTFYNNISSGLVAMSTSFYSFQEFYILVDGSIHSIYGQNEYATLISAEEADIIGMWPPLQSQAVYIGRIVFQKSDVTAQAIMTPWGTELFASSATGDHTHLTNLTVDDHPQYTTLANRTGETLNIDAIDVDTISGEAGTAVTISGIVCDTNVVTATSIVATELDGSISAGTDLQLRSTTHATKGLINVDSAINILNASEPAYTQGNVYWDSVVDTLAVQVDTGVSLQVGQELYIRCKNTTGSPINKGQAVYISGATGPFSVLITEAQANAVGTSCVIGVTAQQIIHNAFGLITVQGIVEDLNTNAFNSGDTLYLSPSVAGGLQNTPPVSPNFAVRVAKCIVKSVGSGTILVTSPVEITELASLYDLRVINSTEMVHLSASRLVATDASKMLVSSDISNWISGTTDQITVTPSAGSVTLSTPQSIATTSSVTFANLTANTSLISNNLKTLSGDTINLTTDDVNSMIVDYKYGDTTSFFQVERTGAGITKLSATEGVGNFQIGSTGGTQVTILVNNSVPIVQVNTDGILCAKITEIVSDAGVEIEKLKFEDELITATTNGQYINMAHATDIEIQCNGTGQLTLLPNTTNADSIMCLSRTAISDTSRVDYCTGVTQKFSTYLVQTVDSFGIFNYTTANNDFLMDSAGLIYLPKAYSASASTRILYVDSSGLIGNLTSLYETKDQITDLPNADYIYDLEPKKFKYKKKVDGEWISELEDVWHYGLIANDSVLGLGVESINKDLCVWSNEDTQTNVASIRYNNVTIGMLKCIQQQKLQIDSLQARVVALEGYHS